MTGLPGRKAGGNDSAHAVLACLAYVSGAHVGGVQDRVGGFEVVDPPGDAQSRPPTAGLRDDPQRPTDQYGVGCVGSRQRGLNGVGDGLSCADVGGAVERRREHLGSLRSRKIWPAGVHVVGGRQRRHHVR